MNLTTATTSVRACDLQVGDIAIYTQPETGETLTFEVASLFPTKATGLVCFESTAGEVIRCAAALVFEQITGIEDAE